MQSNATFLLATAIASALISAAFCIIMRPLFLRCALARPNGRSSHRVPTPQGGGLPVLIGTITATALFVVFSLRAIDSAQLAVVFVCAIGLAILGATDDISPIEPLPRLIVQLIAAGIVLAFIPASLRIIDALPFWLERALLLIGLLWFVNLVNFMDGIDWMTVAEVVPITAGLVAFGFMGGLPTNATLVALALCGAMIGFAPFNKPMARLFLGDVGSLPIGLLLAWLLIMLAQDHFAAAILLPLYYLADATITLLHRLVRGERIMEAHRSHFYQRALDGGMSVMHIVGHVFWLNIALALLAAATALTTSFVWHIAAVAMGCLIVGLVLFRFERARA